jgi:hypothetical protein
MRMIEGTLYCNDGDWVESRTALVEHWDGRLEILVWADTNLEKIVTDASSDARESEEAFA